MTNIDELQLEFVQGEDTDNPTLTINISCVMNEREYNLSIPNVLHERIRDLLTALPQMVSILPEVVALTGDRVTINLADSVEEESDDDVEL